MHRPNRTPLALLSFLIAALLFGPGWCAEAGEAGVFASLNEERQNRVFEKLRDELLALRDWDSGRRETEKRGSKSLKALIEEQAEADSEARRLTRAGKAFNLSKEYAVLAAGYIANNFTEFSQVAGEISVGDFGRAKALVPEWGAIAFGKLVSDALGSYDLPKTQTVWDAIVDDASSCKNVAIAFASGDTTNFNKVFWEETQVVGKKYSKKITAQILNWIFSDFNDGWNELTGQLPALNLTAGDVYVGLVEAELEMIEVFKNYLRNAGETCLDKYVQHYDQSSGDIAAAYHEFEICSTSGIYASSFWDIEAYITQAGKTRDTVYPDMLEAYRKYRTPPDAWLQKRLNVRKNKIQTQVDSDLVSTQHKFETVSLGFMGAVRVRLSQLAWEEMTEAAKDAVELKLAAIIKEIGPKLDRMRDRQGKTLARCSTFDKAEAHAAEALKQGERISAELFALKIDIESLPSCDIAASIMQQLTPLENRAEAERKAADRYVDILKQAMEETCRQAQRVKTAGSKAEAKTDVDKCQDAARQAADAAEKSGAGISQLRQTRDSAAEIAKSVNEDQYGHTSKELEKLAQKLSALQNSIPEIKRSLTSAKSSMSSQVQPVKTGAAWIEQTAREVQDLLKPFEAAPAAMKGAERVKPILDAVRKMAESVTACSYRINQSWSEGGRPWQYRDLTITTSPDDLAGKIARARKSCEAFMENAKPADVVQRIGELYSGADAQRILIDMTRKAYEKCVAQSLLAYNAHWLKPRPPSTDSVYSKARAALDNCDCQEAQRFLDQLPEGPEKAEIETDYQNLVKHVENLRSRMQEAKAHYKNECYAEALLILNGLLGATHCARQHEKIKGLIARIETESDRGARERNARLLEAKEHHKNGCFKEALSILESVLNETKCNSKRARIEILIAKVQSDREAQNNKLEAAREQYQNGNQEAALSILKAVLSSTRCETPRGMIDGLISKIEGETEKKIPDFKTWKVKAAIGAITGVGMIPTVDWKPAATEDEANTVYRQDPPPGAPVVHGGRVILYAYSKAEAQPVIPPQPLPTDAQVEPFVVVFKAYYPDIKTPKGFFKEPPPGADANARKKFKTAQKLKQKQWINSLTINCCPLKRTEDPMVIRFSGDSLKAYDKDFFQTDKAFSLPIILSSGPTGSMLLKVEKVFNRVEDVRSIHPRFRPSSKDPFKMLEIKSDSGDATLPGAAKAGPITEGWSEEQKRKNFHLFKMVMTHMLGLGDAVAGAIAPF